MSIEDVKMTDAEARSRVIDITIGSVRQLLHAVSELTTDEETKEKLQARLEELNFYISKMHGQGWGIPGGKD
ncbi:hypothetical protein [Paracoccus sp. (in: a-proteobacteria)]|uniref:hypothetical protein n=1 Tax=Paracoccus sp. TaxID=267 RepID=UPI00289E4662|nr:hypothetical protein [Paracoccus sp. (in: a-proteobacteria)]